MYNHAWAVHNGQPKRFMKLRRCEGQFKITFANNMTHRLVSDGEELPEEEQAYIKRRQIFAGSPDIE